MNIAGVWYNELGSQMTLYVKDSSITGKYVTAVGDADGVYDLVGRLSIPDTQNRALGFVVAWQNAKRVTDSATSWSGEAQVIDGEQTIVTTWLLTLATVPKDDWKSTLVGKDKFVRTAPSAQAIERAKLLRGPSHHLDA
jgi:hypothetical protein